MVGDKPFIWIHPNTQQEFISCLYKAPDNTNIHESWLSTDCEYEVIAVIYTLDEEVRFTVVDYFDPLKECTCDFVQVILTTGCKCGGQ